MRRFVEGVDRSQTTLFPESLDQWVDENSPVRVIDALELTVLGFGGVMPEATGRPSYHPAILLKLYIYGTSTGCSRSDAWSARLAAMSS
jgi:transposase